ncbi:MAG: histidine phosphatase family protein [Candidatus Caenarcaniphilales bacterium]|nr:histidine phosphatase family protein [Candidatus Caenarcaniphilales bacterium]
MSEHRTIWLIRHAQSFGNQHNLIQGHMDTPLTELGIEQSERTGIYFEKHQPEFAVKHIFASDLKRAYQTAHSISSRLGLHLKKLPELREAHFGKWEGKEASLVEREDPEVFRRWRQDRKWRPQWCEPFDDFQQRGVNAILKILDETYGNLVVVSHGGIIHAMLVYWLATETVTLSKVHNCGIATLKVFPSEIMVVDHNFVAPSVPISPEMNEEAAEIVYR